MEQIIKTNQYVGDNVYLSGVIKEIHIHDKLDKENGGLKTEYFIELSTGDEIIVNNESFKKRIVLNEEEFNKFIEAKYNDNKMRGPV